MNLLKVKSFRCYQSVRVNQQMVNHYFEGDRNNRASTECDAFFAPTLGTMILKRKVCGTEQCIPLTNIQEFTLCETVIKKTAPTSSSTETASPVAANTEAVEPAAEVEKAPVAAKKKATKKVTKKATPKKAEAKA